MSLQTRWLWDDPHDEKDKQCRTSDSSLSIIGCVFAGIEGWNVQQIVVMDLLQNLIDGCEG